MRRLAVLYINNDIMAGIYVHVPFCKTRCSYCDFYSTTFGAEVMEKYTARVCVELSARKKYPGSGKISSVYFGGGTPSRLEIRQLKRLFDCICDNFEIADGAEITVEANPDDLCDEYVQALRTLPFNRVSMGVQSFNDNLLAVINRRHTAQQAVDTFNRLRGAGFGNISIDLIYGLPGETLAMWENDVVKAITMKPEHVSAYALTYEPGTLLYRRRRAGEIAEADEDLYVSMYGLLMDRLNEAGYEHYEISNFSLPGRRAVHNSSYWTGEPYLGVGPGAHSYDDVSRRCNTPDVMSYISSDGDVPHESELLDMDTRYDEMVMTRLRTREGIDLGLVRDEFGGQRLDYLMENAARSIAAGQLEEYECKGRRMLRLTRKGIFVSDEIMSDMMAG